jgi:hypothetical protein
MEKGVKSIKFLIDGKEYIRIDGIWFEYNGKEYILAQNNDAFEQNYITQNITYNHDAI